MSKDTTQSCQAIVIGAGVSGLAAAKWLTESGVNVLVLEARNRVGGRTLTKRDPKIKYVDLGGAYVGPTQNHLLRMSKELGMESYKVYDEQATIYYHESGTRKVVTSVFPKFWNPIINMDVNNFFRTMDKYGAEIPPEAPWNAPRAEEWDKMTVQEFANKVTWTKTAKEIIRDFINLNVTSSAYEASLLWFLWYVRQCGGVKRIFSVDNGGQERKFLGGMQQLSEKIAAKLGDRVLLNKPVTGIDQTVNGVVKVTTLDGDSYQAEYLIMAIPPPLQMRIHFQPALPCIRNQFIQRIPMGSVIKCHIYYKKAFWREKGFSGAAFISGGDDLPVTFTMDDTKPDGAAPAIIGFILADKARRLCTKTVDERRDLYAKSLARVFDLPDFLDPVQYEEHNWMAEQYSGGCYTVMYPPGTFSMYGRVLREPVGRIYFAGTETAIKWSGYIDGAISSGERAAREILHAMGKITRDHIWREEPESQDVRPRPFPTTFSERYTPSVACVAKLVKYSTVLGVLGTAAYVFHRHRSYWQ